MWIAAILLLALDHGKDQILEKRKKNNNKLNHCLFPWVNKYLYNVREHMHTYIPPTPGSPDLEEIITFGFLSWFFSGPISLLPIPVGNQYPEFKFSISLRAYVGSLHTLKALPTMFGCCISLNFKLTNTVCIHIISALCGWFCQVWVLYKNVSLNLLIKGFWLVL